MSVPRLYQLVGKHSALCLVSINDKQWPYDDSLMEAPEGMQCSLFSKESGRLPGNCPNITLF